MSEIDADRAAAILRRIHDQVSAGDFRVTQHAQQEMAVEFITLSEVQEAITRGQILTVYEPKLPKWVTPAQRRH